MILLALGALLGIVPFSVSLEIPPYTGKYNVGMTKQVIAVDPYPDFLAPGNISTSFLATFFYPTLETPARPGTARYMDRGTANTSEVIFELPAGTLANLTSRIIWDAPFAKTLSQKEGHLSPTLIFSPALQAPSIEAYTLILSELASQGYTVAALAHPYELGYVLYPNGSEYYGQDVDYESDAASIFGVVYDRVNDTLAFIDTWPALSKTMGFPSATKHFGIFGHSIGGAVALEVAQLVDPSIVVSGINLDGEFVLALNSSAADIKRPSLLLAHQGHNFTLDPTWATYTKQQSDWWRFITVEGTGHWDFSDATFWKELYQMINPVIIGDLSGTRMIEITKRLVGGFFNWTLLGHEDVTLFNHPALTFPELVLSGAHNGSQRKTT
ncbi:hypothetical protein N0V93_003696 [Gnomoniopsis smithogilvyi]|uniref:1-alkyl-2-acetylglycerophosphocholine esterase n=1 Tax=Gnomoniopsis smithogilvyi TaxID=1191159 RepID=A0A9W8YZ23_9PEZI|nr:hypothetical protein N0V93_003696 [Gnomoniopsis smithogilvyi]